MADKETIRPIYSELQGYLAQAPKNDERSTSVYVPTFWEQYNTTIQELNSLTNKDYNRYKLTPITNPHNSSGYITKDMYSQKLGGLIARLHGEYFSEEQVPFAEMPSTVIQQNQNQSVQIEFILEVNNVISDKLHAAKEGSKEKSFLEKVRGSLSKVKNVSQLIPLIITTAKEMGISINELSELFN